MKKTGQANTNQSGSFTNQYGYQTPPDTADVSAYRAFRPQLDPTIGFRAGASKRQLEGSFLNPLGGATTPQIRDATLRSGFRNIDEQAAQQSRAGQYDVNQQRMGQLGSLAALTRPQLTQTGGSYQGQGQAQYKSPKLGDILGAAAQVGAAFF